MFQRILWEHGRDAFLSAMVVTREFGLIIPHGFPKRNLLMKCLWKRQNITIKLSGNVAKSGSGRHSRVDSAFFATK